MSERVLVVESLRSWDSGAGKERKALRMTQVLGSGQERALKSLPVVDWLVLSCRDTARHQS